MKYPEFIASFLLALIFSLIAPGAAHAAESYDNCTGFITAVPAVITTPGTWCLKKDLSTAIGSGSAITINVSDVVIDCNDFKLGGLAAGNGTQAYGILANARLNIGIRNCNIRGFFFGLLLSGSQGGHTVEDNRFDGNTYIGMLVAGDGSVVRRNRVSDTGGTLVGSANGSAVAIGVQYSTDVLDNTVSGVAATSGTNGDAVGISSQFNDAGSSIMGNRVRELTSAGSGRISGFGSYLSQNLVLRNNDLVGNNSAGSIGMICYSATSHAKDNVIEGFAAGLSACGDNGNLITP